MANRAPKSLVCGRLGQDKPYGTVDVCKLPDAHTGPHEGAHHGLVWEDVPGKRSASRVLDRPGAPPAEDRSYRPIRPDSSADSYTQHHGR